MSKPNTYQNLESMVQNKPIKSPPYHSSDALRELDKLKFHEITKETQAMIDKFLGRTKP